MNVDKMPPLPNPDIIVFDAALQSPIEGLSLSAVRTYASAYGQWCRQQALEEAAKVCESVDNFDNPMTAGDCADAIRALKDKA